MVVIVNERLKQMAWLLRELTVLDGHQVKYASATSSFDLLVQQKDSPHLALALLDGHEDLSTAIARLNALQRTFKHCFAIGDVGDDDEWAFLNVELFGSNSPNCMRLLRVQQLTSFPAVINNLVKDLSAKKKLDLQVQFFDGERAALTGPAVSPQVAQALFSRLQVPREDASLIMDCLGSLAQLALVDWHTLVSSVPVDSAVLARVHRHFHPEGVYMGGGGAVGSGRGLGESKRARD